MLQKSVILLTVISCQIGIKKHSLLVELWKLGVALPPSSMGKQDVNIELTFVDAPHTMTGTFPTF